MPFTFIQKYELISTSVNKLSAEKFIQYHCM